MHPLPHSTVKSHDLISSKISFHVQTFLKNKNEIVYINKGNIDLQRGISQCFSNSPIYMYIQVKII